MIGQYRDYLIQKLKEAGIKSTVHTSFKKLSLSQESHVGAVLFEGDKFERSGSKTIYRDERGDKQKRFKVFDRGTTFNVVIGEYDQEKCEAIFESFMSSLDKGLVVDGNFIPIEIEDADWVDKDDSILKAKVAVQIKVRFDGGIYKDVRFAKVKEYKVENIQAVKEESYGD